MDPVVIQYCLRFGLPIGSAFVVAVILDNIIACDSLLKEIILASTNETSKEIVDSYNYHSDQYPVFYVLLRTALAFALWAILVKSPRTLLFLWVIAAVALDTLRHGNLKMMFDALSSFNIYLLVLMPVIRIYLFLIFIEVARVIEKQKEPRLLVGSYDGADEDLQSLVPIGYDGLGIWKYYCSFPVLGSRIFITVDLVWTFVALPAVKAALGGFFGFILTLLGSGLDGYAISSIIQKQPSGVVLWRFLLLLFVILMVIVFGVEFMATKRDPTEQGIISTLTLALMLMYKIFLLWFSSGIEGSLSPDFPTTSQGNAQLPQIEAGPGGYQVSESDWALAPMTPDMHGRVIITELDNRSGRVSGASHHPSSAWGSQPTGLGGISSSREAVNSRSGWGSQSVVSESRDGGDSRSGFSSQPQSVRTSRDAMSTVSSVSGWTTASGRESQ